MTFTEVHLTLRLCLVRLRCEAPAKYRGAPVKAKEVRVKEAESPVKVIGIW